MSTNDPRPRTKELTVETVRALRADDELAGLLYAPPDSPPAAPADRQRVHETWGGPKETPGVELTVGPVASGGNWNGGGALSKTTELQCTAVATESWRDGHGVLAMRGIRDRAAAVLETPAVKGVYPAGSGGQEQPIQTPDESNRLMLPLSVDVRTHHMTY